MDAQSFKSPFMQEAQWRGLIHQGTDLTALDERMAKESITAYIGFDATAKSLHVGSLVPIMWLRLLQKHGHRPLVLMGDGTTLVGDPSGKDSARQMLTPEDIDTNIQCIQEIFKNYLTFGSRSQDASIVRNSAWLLGLKYLEFLRDYGVHFSINRMMSFDSVKLRLEREQPLSFLEFNYMILQAFDFLELFKTQNCVLQLGGSDQWGNIVNGVELVRRKEGKEVFGLTSPLITTSEGAKMGKTAKGAVWLRADHLSPFEFWQFWRNTSDQDVGRFLRLFTDLDRSEIERLEKLEGAEINEAKKILADAATRLCHGEEAVRHARHTAEQLFEAKSTQDVSDLPTLKYGRGDLAKGLSFVSLMVESGLVSSNGEAKRLIRGRGARLNDQVVDQEDLIVDEASLQNGTSIKLSAGRKNHALVVVE